ncbi:hypothetical protein ScalyP_jg3486 [Parmales sp. scaly parma]|nr:hypothetical protein ScalyP_jg3486 [Parmales sp. scaly parma]
MNQGSNYFYDAAKGKGSGLSDFGKKSLPWLEKLHHAPRGKVIFGAVCFASLISFGDFAVSFVTGHSTAPRSHNPDWAEATRSYLRFQNADPISGKNKSSR